MRVAAILVAAGAGTRFGGSLPKQFTPIGGKPVLRWAAEALLPHVHLLQPVGDPELLESTLAGLDHLPPVPGGAARQDSVRAGLEALAPHAPDVVLVHDGARPSLDAATILRLIGALAEHDGAIPAVPVADTLKLVRDGLVGATVPRDGLRRPSGSAPCWTCTAGPGRARRMMLRCWSRRGCRSGWSWGMRTTSS